jgi:hypothetical protein
MSEIVQATGTFCVAFIRNFEVVVEVKLPKVIFDKIDSDEFWRRNFLAIGESSTFAIGTKSP